MRCDLLDTQDYSKILLYGIRVQIILARGITKIVLLGIVGSWWTSVLVVLLLATYFHILVELFTCHTFFDDLLSHVSPFRHNIPFA